MKKQGYGNNRIRRAQEAAKRFTIVAVCVVTAALLGGCSATFLAHSGDVRLDNKNSSNARSNNAQAQNLPKITEIDEPQGTYQIDANYPTAADDPSFDASLITNDTASFTAFKDQGKLLCHLRLGLQQKICAAAKIKRAKQAPLHVKRRDVLGIKKGRNALL